MGLDVFNHGKMKRRQFGLLAVAAALGGCAAAATGGTRTAAAGRSDAKQIISNWKSKPRQVAEKMLGKYGQPNEVTSERLKPLSLQKLPHQAQLLVLIIDEENRLARARMRVEKLALTVDFALIDAEMLGFSDESFDTVVSSLTTCTFPNPVVALADMGRVCRKPTEF